MSELIVITFDDEGQAGRVRVSLQQGVLNDVGCGDFVSQGSSPAEQGCRYDPQIGAVVLRVKGSVLGLGHRRSPRSRRQPEKNRPPHLPGTRNPLKRSAFREVGP